MSLDKLKQANELIREVIFENKDKWDKNYIWISKLLHGQGALKDALKEYQETTWRTKTILVGER